MSITYAQKQEHTQKKDVTTAFSIIDASSQSEILQRKADMANNTALHAETPRPNNTGMPDNLKAGIESLSGFSMDDVRVHYNSSKPATVQAQAYTQGTDIHVAPGQEKHLPHEAWHVAQQMAGRVAPTTNINGMPVNDNAGLEHEADVMGAKAVTQKKRTHNIPTMKLKNEVLQMANERIVTTSKKGKWYMQIIESTSPFSYIHLSRTVVDKDIPNMTRYVGTKITPREKKEDDELVALAKTNLFTLDEDVRIHVTLDAKFFLALDYLSDESLAPNQLEALLRTLKDTGSKCESTNIKDINFYYYKDTTDGVNLRSYIEEHVENKIRNLKNIPGKSARQYYLTQLKTTTANYADTLKELLEAKAKIIDSKEKTDAKRKGVTASKKDMKKSKLELKWGFHIE
jgi:hypothetical protein